MTAVQTSALLSVAQARAEPCGSARFMLESQEVVKEV
jgi:hypothetical protein